MHQRLELDVTEIALLKARLFAQLYESLDSDNHLREPDGCRMNPPGSFRKKDDESFDKSQNPNKTQKP